MPSGKTPPPKIPPSHGAGADKTATRLVTTGRAPEKFDGFVNIPPFRGSTVLFPTVEALERNQAPSAYGRKGNPAMQGLEEALNTLEQAAGSVLTPSGLAAITCALSAVVGSGDHLLVADSVYFPTRNFCNTVLTRMGVEVEYYDPLCGAEISRLLKPNTRAVFTESPGSQTFEIQDLPAIARAVAPHDILVLIDNTWATPLYHQPLTLGADISIQSCTKYITGHSDALLGAICCNERTFPLVRKTWEAFGNCAGSEEIFLALRGLRTLGVRLKQHEKSALKMASWLKERKEVARILYPPLPDDPGHALWKRDFGGASGLFSLILHPVRREAVHAFLDGLEYFGMGWSWGGFESLVVPFDVTKIRTATRWQAEGPALRFHIGLEDCDDLKADLAAGFERLARE